MFSAGASQARAEAASQSVSLRLPSTPSMPSAPNSRFANVHEATTTPVNEEVWHNLPQSVQNRARGVANLANDGGTSGESEAARHAYWRMREAHGFARIFAACSLLDAVRAAPEGTFASGDTAGPFACRHGSGLRPARDASQPAMLNANGGVVDGGKSWRNRSDSHVPLQIAKKNWKGNIALRLKRLPKNAIQKRRRMSGIGLLIRRL